MNYYDCKFERERKANPLHWFIVPCGYGVFYLQQIGGFVNRRKLRNRRV